jgi:hypothetical protein
MTKHLVPAKENLQGMGEAMLALSERERRFVVALLDLGGQRGSLRAAAKIAGFGAQSDDHVVDSLASRLVSDERIQAALQEHGRKLLRSEAPAALRAISELIRTPQHKDHYKAVSAILARIDPEVQHTSAEISVTHKLDHDAEAVNQLQALKALGVAREKLIEVFGDFGLERIERLAALENKAAIVDAEFTVVSSDDEGLGPL